MHQRSVSWLRSSPFALAAALLVLLCASCASSSPDKRLLQYLNDKGFGNRYTGNAEDQNYVTIGDTISITDPFHQELGATVRVDVDGTVVLAEIGAVHVAGQTRSELKTFLTQKYSSYYEQVDIDVRLQTQSKFYFVFGEVTAEGVKTFPGDLTVFQAVMAAGPDKNTANLGRVRVIRADPRDPLVIPVNLLAMFRGDSTDNLLIQERDIVYVPPTMIAELGYFISDLLFPITNVLRQIAGSILLLQGRGIGGRNQGFNNNVFF